MVTACYSEGLLHPLVLSLSSNIELNLKAEIVSKARQIWEPISFKSDASSRSHDSVFRLLSLKFNTSCQIFNLVYLSGVS